MAEFLRWILLALGLLLLVGIWWWGSRRSTQAPGNAELRESTAPTFREPEPGFTDAEFVPGPRERSMPGFEPVSLDPAAFDRIPLMHEPIMVDIEPAEFFGTTHLLEPQAPEPPVVATVIPVGISVPESSESLEVPASLRAVDPVVTEAPWEPEPAPIPPPEPQPAVVQSPVTPSGVESTGSFATAAAAAPNTAEKQKIISVRVCATGTTRWHGTALLAAFELNGLAYGRYQVFHRRHVDGRSLFCVASMTEPGVFDVAKMQNQEFKGVTLFAVLPGPLEPLLTVDELLLAARDLAIALNGAVQDSKGVSMTAQRAAALRDEVARFQALLPVN